MELAKCGVKGRTLTSPSDEKPRDIDYVFDFLLDRISDGRRRARAACQEPTCGAREEGKVISCRSVHCGERLMLSGWRRELRACVLLRNMVLEIEQKDLERQAAADKRGKRS